MTENAASIAQEIYDGLTNKKLYILMRKPTIKQVVIDHYYASRNQPETETEYDLVTQHVWDLLHPPA